MTPQHRLMTYVIIVAGVLAIAWLGTPNHTFTPRGLFLSNGRHYAAISPNNVTLYSGTQGATGTPIGTINIEAYIPHNSEKTMLAAERYAIELAAQHGANHVVITLAGSYPHAKMLLLRAKALRTRQT